MAKVLDIFFGMVGLNCKVDVYTLYISAVNLKRVGKKILKNQIQKSFSFKNHLRRRKIIEKDEFCLFG